MVKKNLKKVFVVFSEIWAFMDKYQRTRFVKMGLLSVLNAIIQPFALLTIVPLTSAISNYEKHSETFIYEFIQTYFGFSKEFYLLFLTCQFLFFISFSVIINIFHDYSIFKKIALFKNEFQKRLFNHYIYKDFSFFANVNSNDLITNINNHSATICDNFLIYIIQLFSNILLMFVFVVLFFYTDWKFSLIILLVVSITYFFIIRRFQNSNKKMSQVLSENFSKKLKVLTQSLEGIKVVKLRNKEKLFVNEFNVVNEEINDVQARYSFYGAFPKYLLTLIVYFLASITICFYIIFSTNFNDKIEILGIFATGGIRIISVINQVFQNFIGILSFKKVYGTIKNELLEAKVNIDFEISKIEIKDIPLKNYVKIENVSFSYKNSKNKKALDEIDIKIPLNKSIGFVGKSGSGKTTCADIFLGLLPIDNGKLIVDGIEIKRENVRDWQRNVSYVPQQVFLLDDTIAKNICFHELQIDEQRVIQSLKDAAAYDFVSEYENGIHTMIGERGVRLSGGQRQRIVIARALYENTSFLVFDEATSALDNIAEKDIMDSILKLKMKKTMIIIAHRLSTIKDCDLIYFFEHGKVIDHGTYDELMVKNPKFAKFSGEIKKKSI